MASFRLTKNTMRRLQAQYTKFKRARQTVHANIQSYIDDYMKFKGTRDDRRGTLEEQYLPRSPQMGWLVFDDGKGILWQEDDIAALIGRSQASISRTLQRMAQTPGWCARLLAISEQTKSVNNVPITAYHEEIFDLILDKYEEEYLQKVINPRRGAPKDAEEVMRFWDYLKASDGVCEFDSSLAIVHEMPDLPSIRWGDAITLLFRKILTPKTGTVFPILFALSYEMVRRWPSTIAFVFGASLGTLGVCTAMLHLRKGRAGLVSDIGAVALMMSAFWGVGLLSDGRVYTPGGTALTLNAEHNITLAPELVKDRKVVFSVVSDAYGEIREILYRTDEQHEYISTGLNDFNFPDPFIEIEADDWNDTLHIDVKYIDTKHKEHGPFSFTYDLDKLRFDLSKEFITNGEWLYISRIAGNATVNVHINNRYADDVVESIVYGINKDVPDTVKSIRPGSSTIASMRDHSLQYVTSYLIFRDGTKSITHRAE